MNYKGFGKELKCRGFQYEIGKKYIHDGKISICNSGFHSCENPIDVLCYYPPLSRFATVNISGITQKEQNKTVSAEIEIVSEMSLAELIKKGVEETINFSHAATSGNFSHAATSGYSSPAATSGNSSHAATSGNSSPAATSGDSSHAATSGYSSHAATSGNSSHAATSGYSSHAATSGNFSHAATSGDSSHAATSGYSSHASTSGKNSIACSIGKNASAKSSVGNWLVLSEYDENGNVVVVKTKKVDGKRLKADTFYKLVGGKFVEADND